MNSQAELQKAVRKTRDDSITQLKSLYRDELAAIETYDAALHHTQMHPWKEQLLRLRSAHAGRLTVLTQRLLALGTPVPASSGAWGTWVRFCAEATAAIAPEMAFSVILEEEESLARDYQRSIPILDSVSSRIVDERLLPAQMQTYESMRVTHAEAGR